MGISAADMDAINSLGTPNSCILRALTESTPLKPKRAVSRTTMSVFTLASWQTFHRRPYDSRTCGMGRGSAGMPVRLGSGPNRADGLGWTRISRTEQSWWFCGGKAPHVSP